MGVSTSDILFSLQKVTKSFGPRVLFEDATLSFLKGVRIGVIGPNGMGKSTLLKIIAGVDKQYLGEVIVAPGTKIGYVPQEPRLAEDLTVMGNLELAVAPIRALLKRYEEISARLAEGPDEAEMNDLLEKMSRLQDQIDAADAWELDRHIEQAMMALRLPPPESGVKHLSGGERRRVGLCRALLEHPDLLLLDEPTNHLDADTVQWLERHLQEYSGTVILVTHDRYFLDNVVGWMLEVDRGELRPFEGNYSTYLEQKEEIARQQRKQDDERAKLMERELAWVRENPKARSTKNKARVQRYDDLVAEHKKAVSDEVRLHIPFTKRLGDKVLVMKHVTKKFGDRVLFQDFELEMPPGAILGVVGPNGSGKTTLMRMIVGQEQPDSGQVEVGASVDLCYLDQSRAQLKADNTVYKEITGGIDVIKVGYMEVNGRAYVSRFNFRGPDQQKAVGDLSGGERNRVQMAKMLARGGNVVLLDEPTNDLDLPTLRHLEEALLEFPGCAIVVTHDRWFLDRIATHILAFEGDGAVYFHPGNFESWHEAKARLRVERGLPAEETYGTHRKFKGS